MVFSACSLANGLSITKSGANDQAVSQFRHTLSSHIQFLATKMEMVETFGFKTGVQKTMGHIMVVMSVFCTVSTLLKCCIPCIV